MARLAIDPATKQNGCLHIIPRSHRTDLPHARDPVQSWVLEDGAVDMAAQIAVELQPGDAGRGPWSHSGAAQYIPFVIPIQTYKVC